MERHIRGRLMAAAMFFTTIPFAMAPPAQAQVSFEISFDSFHDRLARYGDWVYSDRWGTVWQPGDVPDDFRPYDTGGHWEYTDEYGWTWISDYDWGDVAFHYGRWVYDPDDGWLWMPGYVWSPAWVVWRGNNDYLGWMPMPPDDNFLYGRGDIGVSVSWGDPVRYYNDWYGPSWGGGGSLWVFVNYGHIADRDYHRYQVPRAQVVNLVRQTTNITNYTVVNNYVVNRSVDVRRVEKAAHHPIRPVAARTVIKHPDMIATVTRGEQVRAQMIHAAPRGSGKPGSAPPPTPAVINTLSDHAVARGAAHRGGPPQHLFTRSALTQPGAADHFHGKPVAPGLQGAAPIVAPMNRDHRTGGIAPGGANQPDNAMRGRGAPNDRRGEAPPPNSAPSNARQYDRVGNPEHGPANNGMNGQENRGRHTKTEQAPQGGPAAQSAPDNGARMMDRGPRNTTPPGPDNGPRMMDRGPRNTTPPGPDNGARMMDRGPRNTTPPGPDNGARTMDHGPRNSSGPDNGPPGQHMPAEHNRSMGNGPDNGARMMGPAPHQPDNAAPPVHGRGPEGAPPPERGGRPDKGGDQEKPHKENGPPPQ